MSVSSQLNIPAKFGACTALSFPRWKKNTRQHLNAYGKVGYAILNGTKIVIEPPPAIAQDHISLQYFCSKEKRPKSVKIDISDDPEKMLKHHSELVAKYAVALKDKEKEDKALWGPLLTCIDDKLLKTMTNRKEEWDKVVNSKDPHFLWNYLEEVCNGTLAQNAPALARKFSNLVWNQKKVTFTDFLDTFNSLVDSLEAAGKPQSDPEKMNRLKEAVEHVDHPILQSVIAPAVTSSMEDADYPKFTVVVKKILGIELSDTSLNSAPSLPNRGAKRRAGEMDDEDVDRPRSVADMKKQKISDLTDHELRVMAIAGEITFGGRGGTNQKGGGGRGGSGRGGGGRGAGGGRDAGGRDGGGRGRGGQGRGQGGRGGRGAGGRGADGRGLECFGCGKAGHRMAECRNPAHCKQCGGGHHTDFHELAMKFGGAAKDSQQSASNQITGNTSDSRKPSKKSQAQNAQVSAVSKTKPSLERFKQLYETDDSDDCSTNMITCPSCDDDDTHMEPKRPTTMSAALVARFRAVLEPSVHMMGGEDEKEDDVAYTPYTPEEDEEEQQGDEEVVPIVEELSQDAVVQSELDQAPSLTTALSPASVARRPDLLLSPPLRTTLRDLSHYPDGQSSLEPIRWAARVRAAAQHTHLTSEVEREMDRRSCLRRTLTRQNLHELWVPDPLPGQELPKPRSLLSTGYVLYRSPPVGTTSEGAREYASRFAHLLQRLTEINESIWRNEEQRRFPERSKGVFAEPGMLKDLVMITKVPDYDWNTENVHHIMTSLQTHLRHLHSNFSATAAQSIPRVGSQLRFSDAATVPEQAYLRTFWEDGHMHLPASDHAVPPTMQEMWEYWRNAPLFRAQGMEEQRVPYDPELGVVLEGPWRSAYLPTSDEWARYMRERARIRDGTKEPPPPPYEPLAKRGVGRPRKNKLVTLSKAELLAEMEEEKRKRKRKREDHDSDSAEPEYENKRDRDDRDDDGPPDLEDEISGNAMGVHTISCAIAYVGCKRIRLDSVLYDTGSSFNMEPDIKNYPDDFEENDGQVRLIAANGNPLKVTHAADIEHVGMTVVSPDVKQRICSGGQLLDQGYEVLTGRKHHLHVPDIMGQPVVISITHPNRSGTVYGFMSRNFHVMIRAQDYDTLRIHDKPARSGSVNAITDGNEEGLMEQGEQHTLFTRIQRERADQVRLLHVAKGHPSDRTLINALNNGLIVGTPLTASDVHNARALFGPCPACQAGKARKKSLYTSNAEPASRVGQTLHADIYPLDRIDDGEVAYGGSDFMLFVVDEFSGFVCLVSLKSKHTRDVEDAFNLIIAKFKRYKHVIDEVHTDSESTLKKATTYLGHQGIVMKFTPPHEHAHRVERYVQTVNQRVDCMRHSSPVDITGKIHGELAKAAAHHLNDLPSTRHNTTTPRTIVTGEKFLITDKDVLIPFGTVGYMRNTEAKKGQDKSQIGLVLGPTEDSDHAYDCYIFSTRKKVSRSTRDIEVPDVIPEEIDWPVKPHRSNRPNAMNHGKQRKKGALKPGRKTRIDAETILRSTPHVIHRGTGRADTSLQAREGVLEERVPESAPDPEGDGESEEEGAERSGEPLPNDALDSDDEVPGTLQDADAERERERAHSEEAARAQARARKIDEVHARRLRQQQKDREPRQPVPPVEPEVRANVEKLHQHAAQKQAKSAEKKRAAQQAEKITREKVAGLRGLRSADSKRVRRTWGRADARLNCLMGIIYRISVKEAMSGEHAQETVEAIREEIQNMIDYKVGHYVRREDRYKVKRENVLQSFMFLKHKTTPDGVYERTKSRMVANGANQREHMYNMVSSSTVGLASVFLMFNIASYYRCQMATYDIKGAFLHAKFEKDDEVTYIRVNKEVTQQWIEVDPEAANHVDDKGELLLQLDKFIYGLKQSPLKFQQLLGSVLTKMGYKQTENDECMYVKHGTDGTFSLLTVHVDDILQVCTSPAHYDELNAGLIEAFGTITAHPEATAYLGMTIERSACKSYIQVSQRGLIKKVSEEFYAEKGERTSFSSAAPYDLFDSDAADKTPRLDARAASVYLGLIMTLMYLSRLTRPDTLLAVTYLASRSHKCTEKDIVHALRVVRYLESTIEENLTIHCTDLQIVLHCDASSGTHREEGKGHTGFYAAFGDLPSYLHARSGKQKLATLSSTDAEIVAMAEAVKFGVWMRNLITELHITPLRPLKIWQDNKSVLKVVEGPNSASKRSKHMINRFEYARGLIRTGQLKAEHKPTEELSADALTKPLQGAAHELHMGTLMGRGWAQELLEATSPTGPREKSLR